ncbi:hypothetical protein DENSPDRAFT_930184 [Dentipellis sp. KUC8613]|nr:hypothetical protein DENSPDRAFT_930184 [Dentipellis sp. KUC8613]
MYHQKPILPSQALWELSADLTPIAVPGLDTTASVNDETASRLDNSYRFSFRCVLLYCKFLTATPPTSAYCAASVDDYDGLDLPPGMTLPSTSTFIAAPVPTFSSATLPSSLNIVRRGASWFSGLARGGSKGIKLFCELIEKHCGGVRDGWDNPRGIIPGGCSVSVLPMDKCSEVFVDYGSSRMSNLTVVVAAIARFSQFCKHESCGQHTPCREGTTWMMSMTDRFVEGRSHWREIDMLLELTPHDLRTRRCRHLQGLMRHFCPEVERRIVDYCAREGGVRARRTSRLRDRPQPRDTGPDILGGNFPAELA